MVQGIIAKAVLFRAAQRIVRGRKFPAYQANIVAYTVAALAWKADGRVDFDLLWLHQTISEQLANLIGNWAVQIDQLLRLTAEKRMPSEWAKKQECWDEIRDAKMEIPTPPPAELARMSPDAKAVDTATPSPSVGTPSDEDRDDLICSLRQLFRSAEVRSREEIVAELKAVAIELGNTDHVEEEIDSAIRTQRDGVFWKAGEINSRSVRPASRIIDVMH